MMPFAGGIDSLPNGTLLLSIAAAVFYLAMQGRPPSWRRTLAKAGSTALLAWLAWLEGGPLLLVAALALGAAGDAFLAQEGEGWFLAGLASFLAAHIAYVALFAASGSGLEILSIQPWRLVAPAIAAFGALVVLRLILPAAGRELRLPVVAYVLAILAMMTAAATVAAPIIMAGAALFVLSDAILAIQKFLMRPGTVTFRLAGAAVWLLYYPAQLVITLGFLL